NNIARHLTHLGETSDGRLPVALYFALCNTEYIVRRQRFVPHSRIFIIHPGDGASTYTLFGYFIGIKLITKHPHIATAIIVAVQQMIIYNHTRSKSGTEGNTNEVTVFLTITPFF